MFCSNSEGDYYRIVSTQKVLSEVSGDIDIEKVYLHYLGVKVALKYLLFAQDGAERLTGISGGLKIIAY